MTSDSTHPQPPRRQWTVRPSEPPRTWTLGQVTVTKLSHLVLESGLSAASHGDFLGEATREALRAVEWLAPDVATADGDVRLCFHSFVVDTPTRRIVVDTGLGNDRPRPNHPFFADLDTPFLTDLDAAGTPAQSVDVVVNTHLHVDHVGWNTTLVDGVWTPTFPGARYLIDRTEYEFWAGRVAGGPDGSALHPAVFFADSIDPVVSAGLVDLVAHDHVVCDEVRLASSTGHTPGHTGVLIESQGERALITGDAIHHPIQLVHPEWSVSADVDADAARVARRELLDGLAGTDTLVLGTHWGGRTAGRVVRDGDGFRLQWA